MSNNLWLHGLQHARLPCSSISARVCSNSRPLSQWCYLNISSSAALLSFAFNLFWHQGFSNESTLHIKWQKYWSFSFSNSPSNEYSGLKSFRLTGLISLQSKGLSRVFSSITVWKHQFFSTQISLWFNSHICMWLLENQ